MKKCILLLLVVFAFTSGGCGGSSGSLQADSSEYTFSAPFDSDGDCVPDVFGYYDAGWSDGQDAPADGEAYDVPYLNYIDSSDADIDGTFTAKIRLTQGDEYILRYSHSGRPLTENYLDFTILTPDEKILEFDFGFDTNSADAPAEETQEQESITTSADANFQPQEEDIDSADIGNIFEYVIVSASIDIIPPENPCVIIYRFTAPQTGIYEFTFHEMEYSPVSHDLPYELKIYSYEDDSDLILGDITLTPREVLDVQRVLLSYADEFNKDGLPVSFLPEFESNNVYMNLLQYFAEYGVTASGMRAAADNGAYIRPVVYDIPYDKEFKEGVGFYASSGLAALTESAFQKFVLPTPQAGEYLPVMSEFKTDEIITEEEHNREQELENMSTFVLCKNALGSRQMTATNVRLGQISKNVMIKYDILEHQPRMVNVNDLQFSSDALNLLKDNYKDFREDYGDYFVAGYTWGKRFIAVISVTCENRSALDQICSKVKTMASKAQSGISYSSELQEIASIARLNDVDISVEDVSVDGKGPKKVTSSGVSGLGIVVDELKSFSEQAKTATKNDYVRLKACFQRFREVPAAKNIIPAYLPISQNHFNDIVDMTKTIFRTRCSYNALQSIPTKHLMDGEAKSKEWETEFNKLLNDTKNQLNAICAKQKEVDDCRSQFQRLHNKYRALCERYLFYRRLVSAQKSQPRGFSNTTYDKAGSISGGFKTYPQSSIVMGDYGKYAGTLHTDFLCVQDAKAFSTWSWNVTGDQYGNNWRYVWFETSWEKTNNSEGTDRAYPTVGSKRIHWHYEGGFWRRVSWFFKDKIILMYPSDYPFVGLSD